MKTTRSRVLLTLNTVFSTLLGASLKVWEYPMHDVFLIIGMISLFALLISFIPKNDSFLDRWT